MTLRLQRDLGSASIRGIPIGVHIDHTERGATSILPTCEEPTSPKKRTNHRWFSLGVTTFQTRPYARLGVIQKYPGGFVPLTESKHIPQIHLS